MSPPSILVIGSLNYDLITRTSHIPDPGETLTSESFSTGSGGKGANQAVACARLSRHRNSTHDGDVSVRMVGAVGSDAFGRDMLEGLRSNGIDTSGVTIVPNQMTGVATIIVESSTGENRILFSPNANATLLPDRFATIPEPLPDLIVLQLEIPFPTVLQILKAAKSQGIPVLLNPAPAAPLPEEAYSCITHLIVNETEAAILAQGVGDSSLGSTNNMLLANHFRSLGVQVFIVTLGSKGVFCSSESDEYKFIDAVHVDKVVDTTAAGDTFVGAYAVELAGFLNMKRREGMETHTFNVDAAVSFANKAAAKTVEKMGAQDAIPWRDEVRDGNRSRNKAYLDYIISLRSFSKQK